MRVAGYVRVSTDGQCADDKFGLSVQREQIEEYCIAQGHEIVKWYTDEGESGAKERPGFDEIVYETKGDEFDGVVVAKSDRVARDINIYYYYKMMLLKKDIKLISISEDFEAFGVFAPMLEAFTLCVANMERENINKRTSGGRKAKAKQGGYSGGKPPLGYKIKDKEYVIEPKEAELVRKIYELSEIGKGIQEIVNTLDMEGFTSRSGCKLQRKGVWRVLQNRKTYEGFYHYGDGEWVKGKHEAILTV